MRAHTLHALLALPRHYGAARRLQVVAACHDAAVALAARDSTTRDGSSDSSSSTRASRAGACFTYIAPHAQQQEALPQQQCVDEARCSRDRVDAVGPLCGVVVAVSEALQRSPLLTSSSSSSPLLVTDASAAAQADGSSSPHEAMTTTTTTTAAATALSCSELPLLSWLRQRGAHVVGTLRTHTPLAVYDGCTFASGDADAMTTSTTTTASTNTTNTTTPDDAVATAVWHGACHVALTCSLYGPAALTAAVARDVVAYKPTSQTLGTYTTRYTPRVASVTFGLVTRSVHDVRLLWQQYTGGGDDAAADDAVADDAHDTSSSSSSSNDDGRNDSDATRMRTSTSDACHVTRTASSSSSLSPWSALSPTQQQQQQQQLQSLSDTYARGDTPDHRPHNYTVRHRRGRLADIDVGWRDYNAALYGVDGHDASDTAAAATSTTTALTATTTTATATIDAHDDATRRDVHWLRPQARWWLPWQHLQQRLLLRVRQQRRRWQQRRLRLQQRSAPSPSSWQRHGSGLVVGYLPEWHDAYCSERDDSARQFVARLQHAHAHARATHDDDDAAACGDRASSQARRTPLRFVPLPCNVDVVEAATHAYETIADYELAWATRHEHDDTSDDGNGNDDGSDGHTASVHASSSRQRVAACATATTTTTPVRRRVSVVDYNAALRVRDETARCVHECFVDVDVLVLPLLCRPYDRGALRSVATTLPFALCGQPMVSMRVCATLPPLVLVGELGADAALLEHACRFAQALCA